MTETKPELIPITVYEGEYGGDWRTDLQPESWQAGQRLVTPDEYARIADLTRQCETLRTLLAEIHSRPAWDGVENKYESDD